MPATGRPPSRRPHGGTGRPPPSGRRARPGDRPRRGGAEAPRRGSRPQEQDRRPSGRGRPPSSGRRRPDRPARPQTAAQRKAAEVNAKRPTRPPPDPDAERQRIESRTLETWIDEGALRDEAAHAAGRAATPTRTNALRRRRGIGPDTTAAINAEVRDPKRAAQLAERLGQAAAALDRERFDEARRLAQGGLPALQNVAAVHEVIGLAAYRSGRWQLAVDELELANALTPNLELLPVIADAHRALRHWADVARIWAEVREASPPQEVLAEARIVAAGADADQGDIAGALRTMQRARNVPSEPGRVRDHHLRQWYVLGDLHDRAGDPVEATRWFELVSRHDPEFVDVTHRLRALGR